MILNKLIYIFEIKINLNVFQFIPIIINYLNLNKNLKKLNV